MSKLKKMICLLITTLLFCTFSICTFASNETSEDSIQIQIATDKAEYKALGIAEIIVTITNTGVEPIENVTAQVVFNDLAPVAKRNSETRKSVDVLKAGESISFTYNATLNKEEHDLNIFQKIILWLIRLFNGGYTATNNSIDVVAENATDIIFGKFTAKNVIQVGYERNTTSNDSIEEQIQQTEYVQNSIDDFCNSNEYKSSSSEEQISLMKSFLNDLEKNGEIKNIIFEDRWVTFEFKNGWGGGIELVDSHAEDCFQSSTSSAYIDDTRYATEILTLSENTYSNKFDKWTFSVGTTDSCYSMQELANQYSALGLSIARKELATVQTYKEFSGSEFIYIQSHGDTKNGIPVIKSEEFVTKETEKLYADSLNQGDIKIWGNAKTNIWYFYIYPSFFENNYKNNELNDAIVYIGSCNAFGNNNIENHSFYESFKKAGASTVIGFCNSVNVGYSNYFAERLLSYLSLGYSIGESFNEAVNVLGENGNIFWEQYGEPDIRKDDEYPAYPIIRGETNVTLFDKQIEGLGTFTATISDDNTNNPIENVAVEIKSIANTELYHLLKTNSNGTFSIYLPEGNYTCELIHKDYVRKEFEFSVEADNNIVILNSYYLTPKTYLMGTVIDKETNNPVEDASVLLQKIDEAGLIVGEYVCSTDKDGKFEISVPVGNYTYTINKLDMLNELYETATGTVTVSNVTGNVLATVYLSPKNSSGDDNTGDSGENEAFTGFAGGDGTAEKPYQVATPIQLDAVRNDLSAHYIQIADIDMSEYGNWEPIGDTNSPFNGVFDGNGFDIESLIINYTGSNTAIGLFGYANNSIIKNVSIISGNISNANDAIYLGSIAGYSNEIINCSSSTNISANCSYGGGITGYVKKIEHCTFEGSADFYSDTILQDLKIYTQNRTSGYFGGICGATENIKYSKNIGQISAYGKYSTFAGGITGYSPLVSECYNTGNINLVTTGAATYSPEAYIGGISGVSKTITNCYNTGMLTVKSNNYSGMVGGISGLGYGSYSCCYNIGKLTNNSKYSYYKGGIIGLSHMYTSTLQNCYSNISTIVGSGNVASKYTLEECEYLTNEELIFSDSYKGFDFNNTWKISETENNGSPYLLKLGY